MNRAKATFRALSSKNYRLFMAGQGISLIGTWVQQTAMSWLVYRLTHSAALLGVVGFCSQIPSFFVAPFAGVLADRINKHRLIILTQALSMIQALTLGILLMTDYIKVWHIPVLSLFLGLVNAFDIPTRQSFVIEMVEDKSLLGNAIALNSSMVNVARMIGPTIAGIMIAAFGEEICFFTNAASYVAVIISLLLMKNIKSRISSDQKSALKGLREGFNYAFGFMPIKVIILQLGLVSLTGVPFMVLLPIFASDILHGGPHTLGFLMGASGVGALCGALFLASRKDVLGLGKIIASATLIFGCGLVFFSISSVLWLSMTMLFWAGFGMMVQMAASNTILQTIVDDDKRGRVMSFFTMAFIGMAPFGSLWAGTLASHIGAPKTLFIGGVCCMICSAVFSRKLPDLRKMIRPVYEKIGIIKTY
ncbi:MFS transporter [Desulforegula conservatrix]|uniref:MFS transporter n=1 Tax=Desulforegula conservatrix TaxID=153026 RepID=UPI0004079A82|nr:MFS transporter [Desulforegula conservatrix]